MLRIDRGNLWILIKKIWCLFSHERICVLLRISAWQCSVLMFLNVIFCVYKRCKYSNIPLKAVLLTIFSTVTKIVNVVNFVITVPLTTRAINNSWKFSENAVNKIEITVIYKKTENAVIGMNALFLSLKLRTNWHHNLKSSIIFWRIRI